MIENYEYSVEECDIPKVRHLLLREYRKYRNDISERLNGNDSWSIKNQILDLTWNTTVFRTLNQARFLESTREVNGTMWELIVSGYASMMILGIRRLIDKDRDTNSLISIIDKIKSHPEFHTRELYVSHDGLPFNWHALQNKAMEKMTHGSLQWLPTKGPQSYAGSELAHKAFDQVCGETVTKKRLEKFSHQILEDLITELNAPVLKAINTLADQRYAHVDRHAEKAGSIPNVTYDDIDIALETLARAGNKLSHLILNTHAFGTVVAVPQFNVLEHLDQPWVTKATIPLLKKHWDDITNKMDRWAY